jgi:hypothetical protein
MKESCHLCSTSYPNLMRSSSRDVLCFIEGVEDYVLKMGYLLQSVQMLNIKTKNFVSKEN